MHANSKLHRYITHNQNWSSDHLIGYGLSSSIYGPYTPGHTDINTMMAHCYQQKKKLVIILLYKTVRLFS